MTLLRVLAGLSAIGIVVVWIVYPLVVAVLAAGIRRARRWRRSAPPSAMRRPASRVSVVIATRDEASAVRDRIADCLHAADSGMIEIVVGIDARAGRASGDELAVAPNVRVVGGDLPGGKAATLNAAVRATTGDLLLFTDIAQRFEPRAIPRLVAAFDDERVGAASGRLELSAATQGSIVGWYWSYERWLRRCEAELHSCVGATGAIWALRRSLWTPLPPDLILDDVYAPMRVVLGGHRTIFVDGARAVDVRRPERSQEYLRKVRTLTGVLQLCAWLPAVLLPNRNPIWLQFVFHKLLRLLTPYWLLFIALWASLIGARWVLAHPSIAFVLAAVVTGAAAWRERRGGRDARRVGSAIYSGLLLQRAVVVAALNGIRRRWDVWRA